MAEDLSDLPKRLVEGNHANEQLLDLVNGANGERVLLLASARLSG